MINCCQRQSETMATTDPYAHGSLAAIRAERERKKKEAENKENVLMDIASDSEPSNDTAVSQTTQPHLSKMESAGMLDDYGFLMTEDQKAALLKKMGTEQYKKWVRTQNERIFKWQDMLKHWDTYNSTKKSKLKSRIRKGIPKPLRSTVWLKIMGISDLSQQQRLLYAVCDFAIFLIFCPLFPIKNDVPSTFREQFEITIF